MKKFLFLVICFLFAIILSNLIEETTRPPQDTQPYLISHHEDVSIRTPIFKEMVVEMEIGTSVTVIGPAGVHGKAMDEDGNFYYKNLILRSGEEVHISVTTPTTLTITP